MSFRSLFIYCCALLVTASACNSSIQIVPGSSRPVDTKLFGTWRLENRRIQYISHMGTDSTLVKQIPAGKWLSETGVQSPVLRFDSDGKYQMDELDANGNTVLRREGYWTANGKTMTLREEKPDVRIHNRQYSVKSSTLKISAVLDYDRDGKDDDRLEETYQRQ